MAKYALRSAMVCPGPVVSLNESWSRSANNPTGDPALGVQVQVLASQEDEQIARHTWALLLKSLS
jgi:acetate kinase